MICPTKKMARKKRGSCISFVDFINPGNVGTSMKRRNSDPEISKMYLGNSNGSAYAFGNTNKITPAYRIPRI